ncbi:MAG: hypothetical protein GY809_20055 [Planctomycetes bacterium]|nr:hypothetical protein [Planctomycetota bacterium]
MIHDHTAVNNHGQAEGTSWIQAPQGQVLSFDGQDDYVVLPSDPTQALTDRFSLGIWLYPSAFAEGMVLLSQGTKTPSYTLELTERGAIKLASTAADTGGHWVSQMQLTLNAWNHVAVTSDESQLRFYLNGRPEMADTTGPLLAPSVEPLYVGRGFGPGHTAYQGLLSNVRLYSEALSESDVETLARTYTPGTGLSARFYANVGLSGAPALTLTHQNIDFDWGPHGPDNVNPVTPYSVQWSGWLVPRHTGTHAFSTAADDGLQLWLDNTLLIDSLGGRQGTLPTQSILLDADTVYALRVDYGNHSGSGRAWVAWAEPGGPIEPIPSDCLFQGGLVAEYFNDRNLDSLALVRTDSMIDFDWGNRAPGLGVDPDFSARWSGRLVAPETATYTFHVLSDNGCRLRLNNRIVISQWTHSSGVEHTGTFELTAGQPVDIVLEMYDAGGAAECHLAWSHPGQPKEIISPLYLQPFPTRASEPTGGR